MSKQAKKPAPTTREVELWAAVEPWEYIYPKSSRATEAESLGWVREVQCKRVRVVRVRVIVPVVAKTKRRKGAK